jgi:hypothetical protein
MISARENRQDGRPVTSDTKIGINARSTPQKGIFDETFWTAPLTMQKGDRRKAKNLRYKTGTCGTQPVQLDAVGS